jgi:predicted amino acid racemase
MGEGSKMSYPRLEINLTKLTHNSRQLVDDLRNLGITVMGVNKVFNGCPQTATAMTDGKMEVIAESMVGNLKKLEGLPCLKAMLRNPGLSEVADVVGYADISLVSSIEILEALSHEAVRQERCHQVMLMIDMGDLREGIWFENLEEIEDALRQIISLPNLELYGIGTNFGCYGTILATPKNTGQFVEIAQMMEKKLGIKFPYISGGNGSTYYLAAQGLLPKEINHLRIGGQHIFGIEYVEGRYLNGYFHSNKEIDLLASDAYLLKAEVVEVRTKPTAPRGILSVDAFMKQKSFEDRGVRRTAVLAFGLQEAPFENLHPTGNGIRIMGQTSNHTIVDVEDASKQINVGDVLTFEVDYTALMYLCNAPSVEKEFTR